jgi:cell division transport system permease protein
MQETKAGKVRLRSSYISSVVSISLVLFMLGLLGLLVLGANQISIYAKEHIQLTVFLNDDVSAPEISALQLLIDKSPFTKSTRFISKKDALDSLQKEMGEDASGMIESNPLPPSIDISLKASYAHPDSMKKIASSIEQNKMVKEVSYPRTQVDKMNENFRTVAFVIILFCVLLLFVAVALINSTIRLSLYSKRFLIKSMQLVGATKGFIRKPFISRSLMHGLYAAIIACVLLSGLIYLVQRSFPDFVHMHDLKIIGILFSGVIVFGLLLSGISTYFAVSKHLRMSGDELY